MDQIVYGNLFKRVTIYYILFDPYDCQSLTYEDRAMDALNVSLIGSLAWLDGPCVMNLDLIIICTSPCRVYLESGSLYIGSAHVLHRKRQLR